jgi:hypothetical protein
MKGHIIVNIVENPENPKNMKYSGSPSTRFKQHFDCKSNLVERGRREHELTGDGNRRSLTSRFHQLLDRNPLTFTKDTSLTDTTHTIGAT